MREVSQLALGKKTRCCRLVGQAHGVYRLWARATCQVVRAEMEKRAKRPFFAAAPGSGAEAAVFDQAFAAEAAVAKAYHAATALVDLKSFYEYI